LVDNHPVDRFVQFFPLIWLGMWVLLSAFLSYMSGWRDLAAVYRSEQPFDGRLFWMRSGTMRYRTNYRNALNIGVSSTGLYLSVFFMFRIGHPPLFIPWSDVSVSEGRKYFLSGTTKVLTFTKAPGVTLELWEKQAHQLKMAAEEHWPDNQSS
jgi:hypothetical protein